MSEAPSIVDDTRVLIVQYVIKPDENKRKDLEARYQMLKFQPHYKHDAQYKVVRDEIAHTLGLDKRRTHYPRLLPARKREKRHRAGVKAAQTRYRHYGTYFSPEVRRYAGLRSCHLKWHVARGITNSKCELCLNEELNPDERS
jgi:hypothetical protein